MKEEDKKLIRRYCRELQNSEKAPSTVQKYVRDADKFLQWLSGRLLNRQIALAYKQRLLKTLSPSSVNAALLGAGRNLQYSRLKYSVVYSFPKSANLPKASTANFCRRRKGRDKEGCGL